MADLEKATPVTEDEIDDIRVTLELDGSDETMECKVLTIFEGDDTDYIALIPLDENDEENEDGDVFIYRYKEDEEGNPILENIEDDEEAELVEDLFDQWVDDTLFDEM